ncbi:hypothetical protein [Aminipila terrae]|uniref:Uncharacterized protein n=1 Tax=Aminipila terrae TaxID=2697030 RepID=A0A6P1MBR3_9FIRM|nr:hypothetical protein [Aminipila terrae]QHI71472.1 hypothetical protein Ami3637_02935 [Aminipila terrae]
MNNFSLKAMPFDSEVITNPKTGQEEYDRVAHSKDLADLVRAYFSNGILVQGSDLLTNELQVVNLSAMSCVVKPGGIIINGRTGFLENEQTLEFDVGTQNPRIDRVVAELNIAERNIYIRVLKGIPAADPKPVDIMQTEDIYQIPLAQVRINANQSVIASVTDERAEHISNVLLNQAPRTDVQAAEIKISETVRNLYGLSADSGNVEKALQIILNKVGASIDTLAAYNAGNVDSILNKLIKVYKHWNFFQSGERLFDVVTYFFTDKNEKVLTSAFELKSGGWNPGSSNDSKTCYCVKPFMLNLLSQNSSINIQFDSSITGDSMSGPWMKLEANLKLLVAGQVINISHAESKEFNSNVINQSLVLPMPASVRDYDFVDVYLEIKSSGGKSSGYSHNVTCKINNIYFL